MRPNMQIMDNEEEEVQDKDICYIFSKIIAENSQHLEKEMPFRYRKPPGHQTDITK
jgi:hypothetical protein